MKSKYTFHFYAVIAAAAFLCLLGEIYPVTTEWREYRPSFLLLVGVYFSLMFPEKMTIWHAWMAGLVLDVLKFGVLGQHALAMAIAVYAVNVLYKRIRMYTFFQQMLLLFALSMINAMAISWVYMLAGYPMQGLSTLMVSGLMTALCWPAVFLILEKCTVRYRMV